jgi:Spherulation-specific family 4
MERTYKRRNVVRVLFSFALPFFLLSTIVHSAHASSSPITYKQNVIEYNGAGKTFTLPRLGAGKTGDVFIAQIVVTGGKTTVINAPSGWNLIRRDDNGITVSSALYYHVFGASEPSSYTWTFNATRAISGGIADFSGVNTTTPVDGMSGAAGSGATMTAPSVTTNTMSDMLVYFGATGNVANISAPSGMTRQWSVSSVSTTSFFADNLLKSEGETGSKTATITSGTNASTVSELIALLPQGAVIPAATPTPTSIPTPTSTPAPTMTPVPTTQPTPTPTSIPTPTSTPAPTATPTPTSIPTPTITPTPTPTSTPSGEHIITTLYAYPTLSSWQQVESSAPTVSDSIIDICSPDGSGSGCNGSPADAQSTVWLPTISALKNAGITPLYYISTNYGATALSVVEGEIQDAVTWYGTPSPMFDEMQPGGTCSNGGNPIPCTTYYNDLYTFAVNAGATVVMYNAGTTYNVTSADIFGPLEVMQVFEGSAASFEATTFPSWMSTYPANEFSATISAGSTATVGADVGDAVANNIGNFYEDDEPETPNYSTLPSFWTTEVNDVQSAGSK